jgi:hypothetical protein
MTVDVGMERLLVISLRTRPPHIGHSPAFGFSKTPLDIEKHPFVQRAQDPIRCMSALKGAVHRYCANFVGVGSRPKIAVITSKVINYAVVFLLELFPRKMLLEYMLDICRHVIATDNSMFSHREPRTQHTGGVVVAAVVIKSGDNPSFT